MDTNTILIILAVLLSLAAAGSSLGWDRQFLPPKTATSKFLEWSKLQTLLIETAHHGEIMIEKEAEQWMGFACKKCGAPLALQRPNDPSKAVALSGTGWRVTCPGCGATEYYERGTPTIKITISK